MQLTTIFVAAFAAVAAAAPAMDILKNIPKECTQTSSNTMQCTYTSPHPGAYPVVTSSIKDSCKVDPTNAHHMTCRLPGKPSFGKRSPVMDAESYKFSLVCDDDGCETNGLPHRESRRDVEATDVEAEAYKFSIGIEWKRDLEGDQGPNVSRRDVEAEAYKFSIGIEWKRDLVAVGGEQDSNVARRDVEAEAYKFSIGIEW